MTRPTVKNRRGRTIRTVDEWGKHAGPASEIHWRDGRSAKELARSWIQGDGPTRLVELLDAHPQTAGLIIGETVAEAQVRFDAHPGGARNHDLLVRGRAAGGPLVIGIEAKADETFGETVATYHTRALATRARGTRTNAPERLAGLLVDVAGGTLDEAPALRDLRYQLFSAAAGTLAAAREGDGAVLLVHEFATARTTGPKRDANHQDLAAFVETIMGATVPGPTNWLLGPFHVPAARWSATPLWIGQLTTSGSSGPTAGDESA